MVPGCMVVVADVNYDDGNHHYSDGNHHYSDGNHHCSDGNHHCYDGNQKSVRFYGCRG